MEPETLIGYLVAVAVPLWLLVEGALVSRRSPKRPAKQPALGRRSEKPSPRAPVAATLSSRT